MTPDNALVQTAIHQGVLSITLNRPKVNALNLEMVQAVQAALKQAASDAQVRCVLLAGSGIAFSAGQDVTEFVHAEEISYREHLLHSYNPLILQIRRLEKPVLAAIHGVVSGAALGIALACDLRIAAENARLVVGFAGVGLAPDSAVSLLLPLLIGLGRASEYAFSNTPIEAAQALEIGLINRLAPAEQLRERAFAWATSLAQGPLGTYGLTKRAFNHAILPELEEILDYEAHLQEIARLRPEHREGVQAFLEKRPARFT